VRLADLRAFAGEARGLGFALRDEVSIDRAGPIVVSGILAEQLAKELAVGAVPGSVVVGPGQPRPDASVQVHVIAGDPTDEDGALLRGASKHDVSVVIVELWPQADWTQPFVLSPYVVECRAGEGFPISAIAERIVEAADDMTELASKVPVLTDAARGTLVKRAVVRSALIGLLGSRLGPSRPLLVREQVLTLAKLRTVSSGAAVADDKSVLAGSAAALFATGLALRSLARSAREVLPAPLAHAAIAATGTWLSAKAFRTVESRLPSD
jgi:hypothetical protein